MMGFFYWDPDPRVFELNLPFLGRPILWYGVLFSLGFFLGYLVLIRSLKKESAERLTLYVAIGTLLGARIGDILFYQDWAGLDLFSIVRFWEGGLASHGAAVGILIALYFWSRKEKTTYWHALDLVVIPTAIAAVCIRVGNFMNQEILGTVTSVPWGVVFGHPVGGRGGCARHPVQLYEAGWYFCVFSILFVYGQKKRPVGHIGGLFLTLVFGFRFLIEFVKEEQSVHIGSSSMFTMGQWLSLPLVALGVWLLLRARKG